MLIYEVRVRDSVSQVVITTRCVMMSRIVSNANTVYHGCCQCQPVMAIGHCPLAFL